MGHPSWLYDLFAVAMLTVAAYGAVQFVTSLVRQDPAGRDVDIAHLFMGVTMAGMFEPHWVFWPNWFWEAAFGALFVWFVARSAQSVQRFGLHVPHQTIHAAMSLAMLFMYWFPAASSGSSSMSMSGSSSSHATLDPGIGLLLAFCFLGSAIFTLASPVRGASHHGRHGVAKSHLHPLTPEGDGAGSVAVHSTTLLKATLSPALEDLSHVVMCIGMGFMLVLMR